MKRQRKQEEKGEDEESNREERTKEILKKIETERKVFSIILESIQR